MPRVDNARDLGLAQAICQSSGSIQADWLAVPHNFYALSESTETSDADDYLIQRPEQVDDLIIWWIANKGRFPHLWKVAINILSIPATSTECEQTFSAAKLMITSQCQSLSERTIQQLQCLRAWARTGGFRWEDLEALTCPGNAGI